MFGYSRVKNDVFIFSKKLPEEVVPKTEVDTRLLRLDEVTADQWNELKHLQGRFTVLYLRWRYGSPQTYTLLAYVDKTLAHVEWVVPARKIKKRYPFVTDNSYFIISCLTSSNFRGLRIYSSQMRKVVESNIQSQKYWGMASPDNIPSQKGIYKAGGIKVGEFRQRKWFWGGISRIRYFSIESNNK